MEWYRRVFLKRVSSGKSTDQPTTPCAIHQLVIPHVQSSYEQLDYHISWSPSLQHSHRRLGSQTARQGVSPHSVGWAPVSFRTGLTENSLARSNCRSDQNKCADHFSWLEYMETKIFRKGMITYCQNIWMTHKSLSPCEVLRWQRFQ